MKNIIIHITIGLFSISFFSQSNDKGVLSGSVGVSFGAAYPTLDISGTSSISGEVPTGEFVSFNTFYPIEVNYGLVKPISVGLNITPTSFNYVVGDIAS